MIEEIEKLKKYAKNINVLYVEDDLVSSKNTKEFLGEIFENIIVASDGEDGLEKFMNNNIDLIITDIMMPKLNGLDLVKKIKELNSDTYVIILSQHNEVNFLIESISLNIDGYVLKPIDFIQLFNTINKVIEKFTLKYKSKSYQYYLDQYLSIIEKNTLITKIDTDGNITYANDSFCKVSGYSKDELIGYRYTRVHDENNPKEIYDDILYTIKEKKNIWEGMIKNKAKDGKPFYVKTIITPIKNLEGEVVEYIVLRDSLNAFIDDKKYLFNKIEENELSILILMQINEFEMLEKFYNNVIVDQVEKNFAFNLISYLPKDYKFENSYLLGEGRFALLTDFKNFENAKINIKSYLNEFVSNVKKSTMKFDEMEFDVNVVVSYAIGKYMLFEDAKAGLDAALQKEVKLSFSNDSSIVVNQEARQNLDMIKTVKIALENYNIVSYFQPIIDNKTKEIEKYESLVRLIDEKGEVISPFSFMNVSKKGNYYNKITERVLENSFKILHKITTEISINISAADIERGKTREMIFELLEDYHEDSNRIVFELLEDENISDSTLITDFIKEVKSRGVKIAIDDFGTGYSNFERILKFEPDILKIDGSLVKNIAKDSFSRNLVETIVLFAKKQNIKTVAEFVENEKIFNILNEIGVDYSQGYYFGKPKEL